MQKYFSSVLTHVTLIPQNFQYFKNGYFGIQTVIIIMLKICCQNSHKTKIIITKIIITKLASRLIILNAGYCKNNFQKTSKCHEPKFLPLNNKTLSQSYRNHVLRTNIRKVFKGN